jgi:hypothetical protein
VLLSLAIDDRDITAIRYIYDRTDGRPKETVALENSALEIKIMEILGNG